MTYSIKQRLEVANRRIKQLERDLEREHEFWTSPTTKNRHARRDPKTMHKLETLDNILNDSGDLKAFTGLTTEQFDRMLDMFIDEIERKRQTPLFRDGGTGISDPGNRCKLDRRHALLLTLMRHRTGMTQEQLAAMYGAVQSAVCQYLKLCGPILERILPTPKKITRETAACRTAKELKEFIPGRNGGEVIVDGTRTPHVRPDGESQKAFYSGKIHLHSLNTLVSISSDEVILHISTTMPGSRHDIIMVDQLADAFPSMADPDTPVRDRIRLVKDSGFQGSDRRLPGTIPVQPAKKTVKKKLGATQKRKNKMIGRKRIPVEHVIGDMKDYKIMHRPYEGTPTQFNHHVNIVAGLVNYVKLFKQIKSGTGLYGSLMNKWHDERWKRPRRR